MMSRCVARSMPAKCLSCSSTSDSAQIALAAHLAVVRTAHEAQTVLLGLAIGLVGLAEGLKVRHCRQLVPARAPCRGRGRIGGGVAALGRFLSPVAGPGQHQRVVRAVGTPGR